MCLGWVKKELSMVNLFTFCKMGVFVKSIDCEDVLKSCKEFILTCTADELLDVSKTWSQDDNIISKTWSEDDNLISKTWSEDDDLISKTWSEDDDLISKTWSEDDNLISKTWSEDEDLIKFMLDKDILSVTLPTVTHWISTVTESRVVMVLDVIEESGLQEEMAKMSNVTLELMAKMFEICEEGLNTKRVYKLQTYIMSQSQPPLRPVVQLEIDSGSLLEYLNPKRWREFNLDQITSLHHHYKIEDFFFAEISLDWISSTKPAQPAVGQIWDIIVESKISYHYLVDLRTSIQFYDANLDIPTVNEDIKADKYNADYYPDSDDIKQELTGSGLANGIHMASNCGFKDCILESKYGKAFKLTDTIPCYQLGVEGSTISHYHHDKVFHWYGTEEKKGERVMISFVTNTMAEVIERVRASENIHLQFLECNLS